MTLVRAEDWRPQGIRDLEHRAWEALRCADRSVLVTASAGAGKTEFLAQKAAYLLQTGLCRVPKRILAISFKRDAAQNLRSRVEQRCSSEQARRFHSFTFDAFTKSLIDRFHNAIPAPWSPPSNYQIVMPTRRDFDDFLGRKGFQGINAQQLERAIARTPLPITGNDGIAEYIEEYWREQYNDYEEVLLSFAMINRLVEWLFRENPSIQRALQLTYPFVFLDEFQDTTLAQFELLRTAFDDSGAVFTAVGDDKQRIMVWAGAMDDAFNRFQETFNAGCISLVSNWRSHDELVRIQHVIARQIDPTVEVPEARANRTIIDGDISAIWTFDTNEEEAEILAAWIAQEVQSGNIKRPHDVAILVRMNANDVEERLSPLFSQYGLRLRNEARNVGGIAIQDLLGEDLINVFLPLLRLGATTRSSENWAAAFQNLQFIEAIDIDDEINQSKLQNRLQSLVRDLRQFMVRFSPDRRNAVRAAQMILDFITEDLIRQAIQAYKRKPDFDRVWDGFTALLGNSADGAETWSKTLDEFLGLGQVPLMTIHKSKGLEFDTMIFYGLDNQTWWSLTPNRPEELNNFFVAFTRAKQRAFFSVCQERGEHVIWIENLLEPVDVRRINGATLIAGRA